MAEAGGMIAGGVMCAFNRQGGSVLSTAGGQQGTCFPFGPEGLECFGFLQSLGSTITADGSRPVIDLEKMTAMYTLKATRSVTYTALFLLVWPASKKASMSEGGGKVGTLYNSLNEPRAFTSVVNWLEVFGYRAR